MKKSTKNISAFIIKSDPYREQDLKITIYSLDEGKLILNARGARKSSSKLGGHLQVMSLSDLMIVSGRNLDYIGAAKNIKSFLNIREDFAKLQTAGKAVYVLNRLINLGVKDENIFYLLSRFLDYLNLNKKESPVSLEMYYLSFLWQLLDILGYKPNLYDCYICKESLKEGVNYFNLDKASFSCNHEFNSKVDIQVNSKILKYLRCLYEYNFSKLSLLKINKVELRDLKNISNKYVLYQLEEYLKKY